MHSVQIKPGFTLIEMIVVMGIIAVLISMALSGLTYFQNTITLDNAVRDIKLDIQSAQNSARNSLLVRQDYSTQNLSQNNISVGWLISFSDTSTGLRVVRRSIYFNPVSYDMSALRDDIKSTFVDAPTQDFYCQSNLLYKGASQAKFSGKDLYCSQSTNGSNDFISKDINGIKMHTSATGLPLCSYVSSNGTFNLLLTSGYGEVVSNTNVTNSCQLKFKNASFASNIRGLKVSKDTGAVSVCGNNCDS